MKLFYNKPAEKLTEALPVGRGTINAMVFGGAVRETIRLYAASVPLGVLTLDFTYHNGGGVTNYSRFLDISNGVAAVSYETGGTVYTRTVFCSYPDKILAARVTASKPGSINIKAGFSSELRSAVYSNNGKTLVIRAPETDAAFKLSAAADGGELICDNDAINITGADCVTLFLSAAGGAVSRAYDKIYERHIAGHSALFNRVSLDLGKKDGVFDNMETDKRVASFNGTDIGLVGLLFQYGRYLMIISSRRGSALAQKPFDYAPDFNYWPSETCNLPELRSPYDRNEQLLPGGDLSTAEQRMRALLLCRRMFEHYNFGRDIDFLRDEAFPIMKRAAERRFELQTEDNDELMLIWDLYVNCAEAAKTLGGEESFIKELAEKRGALPPVKIGDDGRIYGSNVNNAGTRLSRLFDLFPGRRISAEKTPDLYEAARLTLEADEEEAEFGNGLRACLWARLANGKRAYKEIKTMLNLIKDGEYGDGVRANLTDARSSRQIGGNVAVTAAVAEMLLQSHKSYIELLPALPKAWHDGSFQGLRARGGFTFGVTWRRGEAVSAKIHSGAGGDCIFLANGKLTRLRTDAGKNYDLNLQ